MKVFRCQRFGQMRQPIITTGRKMKRKSRLLNFMAGRTRKRALPYHSGLFASTSERGAEDLVELEIPGVHHAGERQAAPRLIAIDGPERDEPEFLVTGERDENARVVE